MGRSCGQMGELTRVGKGEGAFVLVIFERRNV